MLTLRCTQRARKRLRLPEQLPEAPASSGAVGDWYVHLVRFGHSEFAIVTSERCLLTMLLPARELRTSLVPNLHASLRSLLERLDVPEEEVSRELDGMQPVSFARATNRRVLGSMNDLAFQASHHLAHGDDLATLAERLAHTPMSAIGEGSGHLGFPDLLARALLAGGVVFNIKGNDYRLVTAMDFEKRIVWIKWVGTHSEYDRIDVKTVAYERPKADSK